MMILVSYYIESSFTPDDSWVDKRQPAFFLISRDCEINKHIVTTQDNIHME